MNFFRVAHIEDKFFPAMGVIFFIVSCFFWHGAIQFNKRAIKTEGVIIGNYDADVVGGWAGRGRFPSLTPHRFFLRASKLMFVDLKSQVHNVILKGSYYYPQKVMIFYDPAEPEHVFDESFFWYKGYPWKLTVATLLIFFFWRDSYMHYLKSFRPEK